MIKNKKFSFVFIGLALFAMFFGSGNLIFPLFVGQVAHDQWWLASIGFLMTAVAVPFLGIIAMIVYRGDYTEFFQCFGKRGGFWMMAILLTVWIPLGSAPRCITLAYSSLASYFSVSSLWVFSLVYCVIIYFVIDKKSRMLDILGYVLTPLLLVCLMMIFVKGVGTSLPVSSSAVERWQHFTFSLSEGYNTMDLIAAFFFSASVIEILQTATHEKQRSLKITFKACLVGIALLSIVYVGLIALAATHSEGLQEVPKDQLLAHIAKVVLGSHLGMVAVVAIFLACFTTSVALVMVYADFLNRTLFRQHPSDKWAKVMTLIFTFVISLTGLKGITLITAPVLKVFYPLLIVLILFSLAKKMVQRKRLANLH